MIIRENDLAGNTLIVNEACAALSMKDFRREQADRLFCHASKKLLAAGGIWLRNGNRRVILMVKKDYKTQL